MSLRPGSVVAGYVIEQRIGSGGMGAVYLARHPRLKRMVALKVLHEGFGADHKVRRAFKREAELVARLDHPNIVQIYDRSDPDEEYLWLSMRRVVGGDLIGQLAAAPDGLAPERVVRLIGDTARALDYAHGQRVLHRDVKPHNILVEDFLDGERAVLTDFGIARALDETLTISGVGVTMAYAAPERFTEAASIDHRADVYSLGCTLFQLLTGHVPFPAGSPSAAIYAHMHTAPPSPRQHRAELPVFLDTVITTALAKNPDERYPTCAALVSELQRALTATIHVPAPPGDPQESRFRRAAETGDISAMENLGSLLEKRGELAEAETWYRRAVDRGSVAAMNDLGLLLKERGELAEAETWYRRAVDKGLPSAMHNLGNLFLERGELAEAETWFRRGAEKGSLGAMNNLGLLLKQRGELAEAETWYRRAADKGQPDAMNNLGFLLKERGELAEAETWYRRAADQEYPYAMNSLGLLLKQRGELAEAETWYRRAADKGQPHAMCNLGLLLKQRGELAEAETWYRRAADEDEPYAMNNLGLLLKERGELAEAETWYRRAVDKGQPHAMGNLGFLLEERGELAEAETWYRRAADKDDPYAMNNLWRLLEERGELAEAEIWYRRAKGY